MNIFDEVELQKELLLTSGIKPDHVLIGEEDYLKMLSLLENMVYGKVERIQGQQMQLFGLIVCRSIDFQGVHVFKKQLAK